METRLLLADDDLEEISCWEAYTRWRAKKAIAEGQVSVSVGVREGRERERREGQGILRESDDRNEGLEMRLLLLD